MGDPNEANSKNPGLSSIAHLEAIVSKNTSEIRVSVEVDAVHIPALSFVPVARRMNISSKRVDGVQLISVRLDANSSIEVHGKKAVDHLESVLSCQIIQMKSSETLTCLEYQQQSYQTCSQSEQGSDP